MTRSTKKVSKEAEEIVSGKTVKKANFYKQMVKRKVSKTAARKAEAALKKKFKGVAGHWKTAVPLVHLTQTYKRLKNSCQALDKVKTVKDLFPARYQTQYF